MIFLFVVKVVLNLDNQNLYINETYYLFVSCVHVGGGGGGVVKLKGGGEGIET